MMERISLSNVGDTKFQKLLGHNPDILHSWSTLEDTLYNKGTLSAELKEQVRRTLAYGNECPYCAWQREDLMMCKRQRRLV
ncbi:hypothetical protein Btoyo_4007 [Bacillus toyonensis BCT-7112]|nr:hypothetical protein Btoyo_4007 [Bacillus toyonensis BCT-7112]